MNCLHCGEDVIAKTTTISWPDTSPGKMLCTGTCSSCNSEHKQDYNLAPGESVVDVLLLAYNVADGG